MTLPEWLLSLDGKPIVFLFKCRIVGYVDADTMDVRFLGEGPARNWRIRLYDEYLVEDEEDPQAHAALLEQQKEDIGYPGQLVWVRHFRHARTQERLEARVDKA